jgi:hypothetical protein
MMMQAAAETIAILLVDDYPSSLGVSETCSHPLAE